MKWMETEDLLEVARYLNGIFPQVSTKKCYEIADYLWYSVQINRRYCDSETSFKEHCVDYMKEKGYIV